MADYILKISEKNTKALALLNYLKTLDFVELTKSTDWWDELSDDNKKAIEKGIKQADEGKLVSNKDAKKRIDNFFRQNG
ncbi:MAG: hypothetical protein A3K10_16835 [Bacteroidetes bacterium RIFCSPLOWO2_12_FULL_31_6]|nr:MAG: hypothetical protein A3K10_16835 [Bacteroidetes bacterium RIFCSPLOWO2_12_FULL_31_6]